MKTERQATLIKLQIRAEQKDELPYGLAILENIIRMRQALPLNFLEKPLIERVTIAITDALSACFADNSAMHSCTVRSSVKSARLVVLVLEVVVLTDAVALASKLTTAVQEKIPCTVTALLSEVLLFE